VDYTGCLCEIPVWGDNNLNLLVKGGFLGIYPYVGYAEDLFERHMFSVYRNEDNDLNLEVK